jgi:urea carboxylase
MEAQYRIAGDHFLIVKYGESFSLKVNFRVLILTERLKMMRIKGVRGFTSAINSLMIDYDPLRISAQDLMGEMRRLGDDEGEDKRVLRSRLIRIPIVYGDRWTRDCAEEFHVPPNLEFVAEHNGMSVEELVRMHSTSTFWILFIGFSPGLSVFVPIDPDKRITAPKYEVPRTWTPVGTIGIGGILNCFYVVKNPGGFQMIGRTPLLAYDLERRNPIFEEDITLFRRSDRIVFEPITHEEFLDIEENFSSYQYQIEEEDWTITQFPDEKGSGDVGSH